MSTFSNPKFLFHVAVTRNFMNFIFSVTCFKLRWLFKAFILHYFHLEKVIFKWKSKCCFLCVHKSTYVKINKKEIHFSIICLWVGKEERVHRGQNDLEDMNMLRYKWLAGNGVARKPWPRPTLMWTIIYHIEFYCISNESTGTRKNIEKLLQLVVSQKSQNCSIT